MSIHTTCPYCGVGCGVEVPHGDDREVRVRGLASHPANAGRLCVKGTHLGDVLPLKQRLLRPAIDGATVAWDDALDRISERLKRVLAEDGPDSIGFYLSGQLLTEDYYAANKLAKGFLGTANVDTNSRLCMSSAVAAYQRALGEDAVPGCYEDLEAADLVVLIGSNLAWAHPVLFQRIQAARQRDPHKKLVVIDPRATDTTAAADLHLALAPGTDGRLLNGLLAWLADQHALDDTYISDHTDGMAATLAAARDQAGTDLGDLARDCGLERADLERFFCWFRDTPKTVTAWSMGINQSRSGVDKGQAILNLHLATGRIGKVGATPFSVTGQPNAMGGREVGGLANQLASHLAFKPANVDRVRRFWRAPLMATRPGLKAVDLFEAAADGRIRVLWILATNPLASLPDAARVRQALERVETVIVSDVVTDTDTLAYADIVLPALAWGEKDGTVTNSERRISRQRGFLIPPGEARPDWWALAQVGRRLGHEAAFDYDHPAELFAEHARLSAFEAEPGRCFNLAGLDRLSRADYDRLQPVQWPLGADGKGRARLFGDGRFATADGRARLVPVTPAEPEPAGDRLRLNTGRLRDQWHSMTRTGLAPPLTRHRRDFRLALNPADAAGIDADDLVCVSSPRGHFYARAEITESVRPGQVFAPMHWNRRFASGGGVAEVIPPVVDPISGQPESKHARVRVAPVAVRTWGLFVGAALPATLAAGAIWFRTEMARQVFWQLYYPHQTPAEIHHRATLARPDLVLDDSEGQCFQALRRGPEGEAYWLSLSARPLTEPDTDWLEAAFAGAAATPTEWLNGRASDAGPGGQLVCTCFNVREGAIRDHLDANPDADLTDVQAALKCSTSCGSCLPEVVRLVEAEGTAAAISLVS